MKTSMMMALMAFVCLCAGGCSKEKSRKDRSEANVMYERICMLTKEYTEKLKIAPDSADWAAISAEFEEKLDKISLGVAPDTDLLLTEGQNDTIHALMQGYVKVREERIHGLLHPLVAEDSTLVSDSLSVGESPADPEVGSGDASRSPGN